MDGPPSCAATDSMAARQFRRELRRWRTRNGLTQRALADRVRFSRETVAAVESGRRYGSQELAVRCDEVLGTGGLLAGLWPQVAAEQLAADGRRGPRTGEPGQPVGPVRSEPPGGAAPAVGRFEEDDSAAVIAAIDELRELIDRILGDRVRNDLRRPSAESPERHPSGVQRRRH
ncbi:helix-turn-helix transcriptional regulator [Micromonospora sp. NPDC049559]|uniref:helix-turn-helix transcriptional regulator n=1 Tax=Micromonospora sp. NPDC049559 TaxID=3155923 RepID=UPI00342AB1E3